MLLLQYAERMVDACFAIIPRPKPSSAQAKRTRLIAHRGAHDKRLGVQENTMQAFERAYALGCWGIEFDVHATADDVLVVNHDSTLNRLWDVDAAISQESFASLQKMVPILPRLQDVINAYGAKIHLFIELKSQRVLPNTLKQTLVGLIPGQDFHIISLDESHLKRMTPFPKSALLLVPVHNNVTRFCNLSVQRPYGGILGHYWLLNDRLIKKLKSVNQLVGVGFVDSKYGLYRELNRGIDYLFTNNAKTVLNHLQALL